MDNIERIRRLVPDYEKDLSAIGEDRVSDDPDPREWHEVHGLTEAEAADLTGGGQ